MTVQIKRKQKKERGIVQIAKMLHKMNDNEIKIKQLQEENKKLDRDMLHIYHTRKI